MSSNAGAKPPPSENGSRNSSSENAMCSAPTMIAPSDPTATVAIAAAISSDPGDRPG